MSKLWGKLVLIGFLTVGLSMTTMPAQAVTAAPSQVVAAPLVPRTASPLFVVNSLFENRVLTLTNKRRAEHGCAPLKLRKTLRYAARKHSRKMARAGTLSHRLSGEPRLGRRVTLAGYTGWRAVAENIAAGYYLPSRVVRAWMASPGHRANILDCSLRHIGVGVVMDGLRPWWTQDFGRR